MSENGGLLKKCKSLSDYMSFVNKVKANKELGMDKYEAIDRAVTECIRNDILKEVLLKHRSEVVSMVLTEFNEEAYKKGIFEEGYAKGQTALADAIKRIRSGATVEDLVKSGIDRETAELAWTCK